MVRGVSVGMDGLGARWMVRGVRCERGHGWPRGVRWMEEGEVRAWA